MSKIGIFCVGTGGHVLPAKNIIMQLNDEGVGLENFIVITDERGSEYLNDLDIRTSVQNVYRSKSGIIGYLLNIHKLINVFIKIRSVIKKENLKVIFSTGSYIAPIASILSYTMGIKYFGHEQNIYAGLGNKITSYLPGVIFTSYPETKNLIKKNVIYVGPVIDKKIINNYSQKKDTLNIGIQGGSQGSEEINSYCYKFLEKNDLNNIKVIHITGKNKNNKSINIKNYEQFDFVENMSDYYSKINLQISRSGGGALEAAYLGIPQILIPFKHGTTSSHQHLNADYLERLGVALVANSYYDFEKYLLDVINNNDNNIYNNFKNIDIQIGNFEIVRYLKEEINEKI